MLPLLTASRAALIALLGVGAAFGFAVGPPLARRRRCPELQQIPLSLHVQFELSARIRGFIGRHVGRPSRHLAILPDVETVERGVVRVLGQNPGVLALQGTATYLVGEGPTRLLIDAGEGNAQYEHLLAEVCKTHGVTAISDLLLTHQHVDHLGGALHVKEAFPEVRIWKFMPAEQAQERRLRWPNASCRALLMQDMAEDQVFAVPGMPGVELRTVWTPGHCVDHVCFLLQDASRPTYRALFTGDCIMGVGTCLFTSLTEFMASLLKLKALAPTVIYPAHGPVVTDAVGKINEYMQHRHDREQEILTVLRKAPRPISMKEMIDAVYGDVGRMKRYAARFTMQAHLEKLVDEQQVKERDGRYALAG